MNRINRLFSDKQTPIMSVYFCAGHPCKDGVADTLMALQKGGVDMVEIGIPFSDPMADGVVIQAAAQKAIEGGMTLRYLFEQLKDVRKSITIPLILMGYLNPIMRFGFEAFCQKAAECGIDGMVIPDLPFADYIRDFKPIADKYDLRVVMLITPETSEERVRLIDEATDGFIYMVSSAATTGVVESYSEHTLAYFHRINAMQLRNPRMIGFGISNKATYEAACNNARGAIIGSCFVSLIDQYKDANKAINALKALLLPPNKRQG